MDQEQNDTQNATLNYQNTITENWKTINQNQSELQLFQNNKLQLSEYAPSEIFDNVESSKYIQQQQQQRQQHNGNVNKITTQTQLKDTSILTTDNFNKSMLQISADFKSSRYIVQDQQQEQQDQNDETQQYKEKNNQKNKQNDSININLNNVNCDSNNINANTPNNLSISDNLNVNSLTFKNFKQVPGNQSYLQNIKKSVYWKSPSSSNQQEDSDQVLSIQNQLQESILEQDDEQSNNFPTNHFISHLEYLKDKEHKQQTMQRLQSIQRKPKPIEILKFQNLIGDQIFFPEKIRVQVQNAQTMKNINYNVKLSFLQKFRRYFCQIFRLRKNRKNKIINTCLGDIVFFLSRVFMRVEKYIPIFEPIDRTSIIFNPVQLIGNLIILFYTTVMMFFDIFPQIQQKEYVHDSIWNTKPAQIIVLVFYFFDILKNFSTGYYIKENLIMDRKKIAMHYLLSYFPFDMLGILASLANPIFLPNISNTLRFILYLSIYGKIISINNVLSRTSQSYTLQEKHLHYAKLFKLMSLIMVIAHFIACSYHSVAQLQILYNNETQTWIHKAEIQNEDYLIRFSHSFFVATSSMITVLVYTPQTEVEIVFIAIIMIVNCGFFGYSINSLGIILEEINQRTKNNIKEVNMISDYMVQKNIRKDLQIRVKNYLQYVFNQQQVQQTEKIKITTKRLSNSLYNELQLQLNQQNFKHLPLLTEHFSLSTQNQLSSVIEEKAYSPGDIIVKENSIDDNSLYIILQGEVEILQQNAKIKSLQNPDYFGEKNFFLGTRRDYTARTCDFTTVLKLSRNNFIKILKKDENIDLSKKDDYENFIYFKDKIIYSKNTESISQLRCFICDQKYHFSKKCPHVHFVSKPYNMLIQEIHEKSQDEGAQKNRQRYYREKQKTLQTIFIQNRIEQDVMKFIEQEAHTIESYEQNYDIKWEEKLHKYFTHQYIQEQASFWDYYLNKESSYSYSSSSAKSDSSSIKQSINLQQQQNQSDSNFQSQSIIMSPLKKVQNSDSFSQLQQLNNNNESQLSLNRKISQNNKSLTNIPEDTQGEKETTNKSKKKAQRISMRKEMLKNKAQNLKLNRKFPNNQQSSRLFSQYSGSILAKQDQHLHTMNSQESIYKNSANCHNIQLPHNNLNTLSSNNNNTISFNNESDDMVLDPLKNLQSISMKHNNNDFNTSSITRDFQKMQNQQYTQQPAIPNLPMAPKKQFIKQMSKVNGIQQQQQNLKFHILQKTKSPTYQHSVSRTQQEIQKLVSRNTLNTLLSGDLSSDISMKKQSQPQLYNNNNQRRKSIKQNIQFLQRQKTRKRSTIIKTFNDLQHQIKSSYYEQQTSIKMQKQQQQQQKQKNKELKKKYSKSIEYNDSQQESQYFDSENNTTMNQKNNYSQFFHSSYKTNNNDLMSYKYTMDYSQEDINEEMDDYMQQWEEEAKKFSNIDNFDIMNNFKIYFPHNNFVKVYKRMDKKYKPSEGSLESFQKVGPSMVHKRLKFQQKKKTQIQITQQRRQTIHKQQQSRLRFSGGQSILQRNSDYKSKIQKSQRKSINSKTPQTNNNSQCSPSDKRKSLRVNTATMQKQQGDSDGDHHTQSHTQSRKKFSSKQKIKSFQIQLSPLKRNSKDQGGSEQQQSNKNFQTQSSYESQGEN